MLSRFLKATAATLLVAATAAALAEPIPAEASTPAPVTAWYMYGTTQSALESAAKGFGCTFAAHSPGGSQIMLLDFGAARNNGTGSGAVDFSGVLMGNGPILDALERASDGVHDCYRTGTAVITYGNSNYEMTSTGTDAYRAGKFQEGRADQLAGYEKKYDRSDQRAAAASDMEPSWDSFVKTEQLVLGATATGGASYYDFGSADGCPTTGSSGSCNNGWSVNDLAYVSAHGVARPLPEIYPPIDTLADQWTVIRRNWNANHTSSYTFAGVTGAPGTATAQDGWNALADRFNHVGRDVVCFGCTGNAAAVNASPTPAHTLDQIPAHILPASTPVPFSPTIIQVSNAWLVSDGVTLVAVYAGASGADQGTGRLVVVRQNTLTGQQTVSTIDVPGARSLSITNPPAGAGVERSAQNGDLYFRSTSGLSGSLDLNNDSLSKG